MEQKRNNAADYRKGVRREIELPSGMVVTLRKPNVPRMLNKYPLQPEAVARLVAADAAGIDLKKVSMDLLRAEFRDLYVVSLAMICDSLIDPPVVLEEKDATDALLWVEELDLADQQRISEVINEWLELEPET